MSGKSTARIFLRVLAPLVIAVVVAGACSPAAQTTTTSSPPNTTATTTTPPAPAVQITSPAAGAALPSGGVTVAIEASNFNIVPPGGDNAPGQGHIHYYMDVDIPTTPGQGAVTAPGTYKATPETSVAWDNVAAGSHTFGVQLVNNKHTPLDPPVTATVTVTVGSADIGY